MNLLNNASSFERNDSPRIGAGIGVLGFPSHLPANHLILYINKRVPGERLGNQAIFLSKIINRFGSCVMRAPAGNQ